MRVWLLKDGENLPIQENVSKMRTWMLAEELVRRGHDVIWWSSTHSHQRKTLLSPTDLDVIVKSGIRLKLLDSGSYTTNRSIARYRHHKKLASRFLSVAKKEQEPDVVVSSFPTIEFANAGVKAAQLFGCTSVVDIRDPWPDVAYNLYSGVVRRTAKFLMSGMSRQARRCLRDADVLFACSQGFLDWALRKAGRKGRPGDGVYYIGRHIEPTRSVHQSPAWLESIPSERFIVSFVGAFGHVYELELICQAARELLKEGDARFHFVLAGDGDKGQLIRGLASKLPNVTVPGWIPQSETEVLMRKSALGLAPYRQLPGCMPNKVFEYVALGLPIISSLEGDLPVLLDGYHAGLSYKPGDCRGLIVCLKKAIESRQGIDLLSDGAKALFRSKFVASKIYAEYATKLERLVEAA